MHFYSGLESNHHVPGEFRPYLPLQDSTDRHRREDGCFGTVLAIEDNDANTLLLRGIFRLRPGVNLVLAEDAERGMELAQKLRPDLILLDLHLPGAAGWEMLGLLRETPGCAHIPVVVVTADATKGQKERLMSLGANAYLNKPFDVPVLLAYVDAYLEKPRAA